MEALQLGEGAVVRALGGIDAALQAGEAVVGAAVDVAERSLFVQFGVYGLAGVFDFVSPGFGFNAGKAAEEPIGADEGIDQETFEVRGWGPVLVIALGEGFELGGIFAGDHLGFGVDAGFERVEARDGFAFRGARAGGELRVAPVGVDLSL